MAEHELLCQELFVLVTPYLDGALSSEERVRLEAHLAECEDCTTHLEQIRLTIRAVGTLASEAVSPWVRDELLEVFRRYQADVAR